MDEVHNFLASRGGTSQTTAVLTNPFPHQQQQLVATAAPPPGGSTAPPPPPQGGNMDPPPQGGNGSTTNIFMCESEILLQTRAHNHDPKGKSSAETASSVPPPETSLHIERPIVDPIPHPPKGSVRRTVHNPNARASPNYSIVDDLASAPCVMSALEVLQSCPSQCNALLSDIGACDPIDSQLITFNLD